MRQFVWCAAYIVGILAAVGADMGQGGKSPQGMPDMSRSDQYLLTNTVPSMLRGSGVSVILREDCPHSQNLVSRLERLKKLKGLKYTPYYVNDNLDLMNYVSTHGGKVPGLFVDGVPTDINGFLKMHESKNNEQEQLIK